MKVKNVYRMVHTMGKTQPGGVRGGTESSEKECILWKEKAEERAPARNESNGKGQIFQAAWTGRRCKMFGKISRAESGGSMCRKEKMSV